MPWKHMVLYPASIQKRKNQFPPTPVATWQSPNVSFHLNVTRSMEVHISSTCAFRFASPCFYVCVDVCVASPGSATCHSTIGEFGLWSGFGFGIFIPPPLAFLSNLQNLRSDISCSHSSTLMYLTPWTYFISCNTTTNYYGMTSRCATSHLNITYNIKGLLLQTMKIITITQNTTTNLNTKHKTQTQQFTTTTLKKKKERHWESTKDKIKHWKKILARWDHKKTR